MSTKQVSRSWLALITAVALAACGGSNNASDDAPDDGRLPDNEPCVPGSLRCNGNDAQQCNEEGTMWVTQETCATFCQEGVCALEFLDVQTDTQLDGVVVVAGPVTIRAAATLSSPAGNLTIFADSLTVENGGTIAVAPTGATPEGKGFDSGCSGCSSGGGQYGNAYGSATDSEVQPGAEGGRVFQTTTVPTAKGGGVLKLIVKAKADISGQLSANGASGGADPALCLVGGGGGSGGGILVVADDLTVTGAVSAAGGLGGVGVSGCGVGGVGGEGRVKLLFGAANSIEGTIIGVQTVGLAPPLPVKSLSHPDPTKIYNDGFLSFDVEWKPAFPTVMGYFVRLDQSPSNPPTAADGMFLAQDKVSFSPNDIFDGENFVHLVSIDAQSAVGTVETVLRVQINTRGPSVFSSSHPSQATFSNNTNPFFEWSYPQGDENVTGSHYVLDNFGTTVPTTADTALPAGQKQLLKSDLTPGVFVLHVVSVDGQGRLSKQAGHYRVNIGTDPGTGQIQGNVLDSNSQPVVGATVTVNRGLFTTTTSSNGTYNLPAVTAGTWELSAKSAAQSASKPVTVTAGMATAANLTLQ
jgi:hypothetical protein